MQVEPNGVVHLLENIPLNNTYQHTIRFTDTTAQYNWFYSKRAHTLNKMTYQRAESGIMRIQKSVDEVYKCNYLMFQNTGFASKWFYAFITGVEYVNNMTTEITYEIDVMQTWFVGCELKQCFIERSHTATDNIGDNLVAENFSVSDFTYSSPQRAFTQEWSFVIVGTLKFNNAGPGSINDWQKVWDTKRACRTAGNLTFNHGKLSNEGQLAALEALFGSDDWLGKPDPQQSLVVGAFMFPHELLEEGNEATATTPATFTMSFGLNDAKSGMFEGHGSEIKNNKLFTHPYSCLEISNNEGIKTELPFEQFDDDNNMTIRVVSDYSPSPVIIAYPTGFMGRGTNPEYAVTISEMPQLHVGTDPYIQWLTRAKSQFVGAALATGATIAAAALNPATLPASLSLGAFAGVEGLSLAGKAGGMLAQGLARKGTEPPQLIGGKSSSSLYGAGELNIVGHFKSAKWDIVKRIDNYFTTFGYAINNTEQPNIDSRPHWNYIKLSNPTITGPAPAQAISNIANILTNGITFWHNGDNVGNYSLDNSV